MDPIIVDNTAMVDGEEILNKALDLTDNYFRLISMFTVTGFSLVLDHLRSASAEFPRDILSGARCRNISGEVGGGSHHSRQYCHGWWRRNTQQSC